MSADLKDYGRTLRLNVVAIDLAKKIFEARYEAFGGGHVDWYLLAPETKAIYVHAASTVLQAFQPASLTGPTYFETAVKLARVEAARVIAFGKADDSQGLD